MQRHRRGASGLQSLRNTQSRQRIQHISELVSYGVHPQRLPFSNSLSDTLGTEHLCHFRRQCQIRLLIIEPCTFTVAGSYSRCIMDIIFGQSVMGVSEGEYDHPRWNCATPAALYYTTPLHRT